MSRFRRVAGFRGAYRAFDRFQRRHGWLGFVLAVRQKYADDQGGYPAATLTCYAFFAVFPLLLLLVTGLGLVASQGVVFDSAPSGAPSQSWTGGAGGAQRRLNRR